MQFNKFTRPNAWRTPPKLIDGKFLNDADYITQPTIDGKVEPCPIYKAWFSIIYHVRSDSATCCDEWHKFMTFREWFVDNYVDDCMMTTSLLSKGKPHYSSETCVFAPRGVQLLLRYGFDAQRIRERLTDYKIRAITDRLEDIIDTIKWNYEHTRRN